MITKEILQEIRKLFQDEILEITGKGEEIFSNSDELNEFYNSGIETCIDIIDEYIKKENE